MDTQASSHHHDATPRVEVEGRDLAAEDDMPAQGAAVRQGLAAEADKACDGADALSLKRGRSSFALGGTSSSSALASAISQEGSQQHIAELASSDSRVLKRCPSHATTQVDYLSDVDELGLECMMKDDQGAAVHGNDGTLTGGRDAEGSNDGQKKVTEQLKPASHPAHSPSSAQMFFGVTC